MSQDITYHHVCKFAGINYVFPLIDWDEKPRKKHMIDESIRGLALNDARDLIQEFGPTAQSGPRNLAVAHRLAVVLLDNVGRMENMRVSKRRDNFPLVVTLCGSTRFYEEFQRANYELTISGHIVLSVGFYPHSSTQAHGQATGCDDEQKVKLDELHMRKIDMCDYIYVLNVGGYIGDSTRNEIAYATKIGRPVKYLEDFIPGI